jgi:hypothetical protein
MQVRPARPCRGDAQHGRSPEECGVEVISATEGKEALSRGIQLVVAEHYSMSLAERTHAGLVKRFEARQWTGGNPCYGYKVIDDCGKKRLAVEPGEAEVIRSLYRDYLSESVGVKELASRLRKQGVPTRKGAEWSFTTVILLDTGKILAVIGIPRSGFTRTGIVRLKRICWRSRCTDRPKRLQRNSSVCGLRHMHPYEHS